MKLKIALFFITLNIFSINLFAATAAPERKFTYGSSAFSKAVDAEYKFYSDWVRQYPFVSGCGFGRLTWTETPTQVLGDIPQECGGPCSCGHFLPVVINKVETCPTGYTLDSTGAAPLCIRLDSEPDPLKMNGPPKTCEGNPCDAGSGNKFQRESDYAAAAAPLPLFDRSYNSRTDLVANLGSSWRSNLNRSILFSQNELLSTARVTRPDGKQWVFNYTAGGFWQAEPDVAGRLIGLTDAQGLITAWHFYDEQNILEVYDPNGKLLSMTTAKGYKQDIQYSCDSVFDVNCNPTTPKSIAPVYGLPIVVSDSYDRQLQLFYDDVPRVSRVKDFSGSDIIYVYTANSFRDNLVKVTFQDGTFKNYLYGEPDYTSGASLPNALTGILDETGQRFATWRYDANGRGISSEHGTGNDLVTLSYQSDGSTAVTEALGESRTYQFETVLGVILNKGYTRSPGLATTARAHDDRGNITSEDDFNGVRACFGYDLARNLETSRVEGLTTAQVCSTVTASPTAAIPLNSRKVSTVWHPDWRLPVKVAEPGRLVTSVYNGQPDPFNGNALASCAPAAALLPDGKPIAVLCKQVEQATTDTDGHLGVSATLQSGVANRVRSWTYNATGQVLTAKGPRTDVNDTTTFAYYSDTTASHTKGDLQTVTNAVGRTTTFNTYNAHGQVLQSTDPNGVVTVNTYDLRQRLLSSSVGGQATGYTYDPLGQLTRVTLPDTSWIGYEYDAAHRQTAVLDNLGNRIEYTLDNAGNRTAELVKDPQNAIRRQLARSIDALGRLQQTAGR